MSSASTRWRRHWLQLCLPIDDGRVLGPNVGNPRPFVVNDRAVAVTAADTALHLQALAAAERQCGADRATRLLAASVHVRELLVGRHGAGRVWLFGSLVAGQPTIESDVDLAVEGLASSAYFSALADLMALFHGPVDLVRLEDAPESLRERVLSEGREL